VGEEAVETIIGAMANDNENFIYEASDLLYHLIVLLAHKGFRIEDIVRELQKRHT
jgi:phosphoribosyl-ATP pyrophosphohydrolase/phosphoribosyl-AMP cyclohydrolase